MKKLVLILLAVSVVSFLAFGNVSATPVYNGPTYADYGEGGVPDLPTETGYYIWSNDPEKKSWSVRWTGNNNDNYNSYDWFGSIEIGGGLDLIDYAEVMFEARDDMVVSLDTPYVGDLITYDAFAGQVWDGFDFTIAGAVGNVIGFNLGSTAWNLGAPSTTAKLGTGIFIGEDENIPMVLVSDLLDDTGGSIGTTQNLEIPAPVPEPATMLLLGAGLLGLVAVDRRRFMKKK